MQVRAERLEAPLAPYEPATNKRLELVPRLVALKGRRKWVRGVPSIGPGVP